MRPLAALALIAAGWAAVRPRPRCRPAMTLSRVVVALFTRERTVAACGRATTVAGPHDDPADAAKVAAAAFEAQLRAALMAESRRA